MTITGIVVLALGAALALLALGFMLRNAGPYARMLAAPSPIGACAAGTRSMVRGFVVCATPITSPASTRTAVFYRLLVYDDEGDRRHATNKRRSSPAAT